MATDKLVEIDHVTDYISREAAWNGIYSCPTKTDADGYIWVRTKDVAHMIDEIPAADVRPVVKAEWVECDWCVPSHGFVEHYKNAAWKCTNCKHAFKKQDLFVRNFCPNCGADMRGEQCSPLQNGTEEADCRGAAPLAMTEREDGHG